jgi:hypothetical protein
MNCMFIAFCILAAGLVVTQMAYVVYTLKERGSRIALVYERERQKSSPNDT